MSIDLFGPFLCTRPASVSGRMTHSVDESIQWLPPLHQPRRCQDQLRIEHLLSGIVLGCPPLAPTRQIR
jgi:hypothetical protein